MCLTEYNEAEAMELQRQEGKLEGLQEGLKAGQQKAMLLNIKNLMESTGWAADKIMEMLKIPLSERDALYAGLSKIN